MMKFMPIQEPQRPAVEATGFALWRLGFRPFFLLASMFAALSIGLWAAQFAGWLPRPYLSGPVWHAHEMLLGFTLAVMVGFLLTAGRNWSMRPTLTGLPLAALALLWVAGRVLVLTPFGWAAAIVNAAFPLAAAAALAVPFWAARNRRNYFFVGLLVLMSAADLGVHFSQLGLWEPARMAGRSDRAGHGAPHGPRLRTTPSPAWTSTDVPMSALGCQVERSFTTHQRHMKHGASNLEAAGRRA